MINGICEERTEEGNAPVPEGSSEAEIEQACANLCKIKKANGFVTGGARNCKCCTGDLQTLSHDYSSW